MAILSLSFSSLFCVAQTPTDSLLIDPGGLYVYTIRNMSFGAFCHGSAGGTVNISTDGTRSVSGDVIALNMGVQYYYAEFEINIPSGSVISILNGPDATLTGSSGGTMSLHITTSYPEAPFVTAISPPSRTQINIGGTLTVGNNTASPPGNYSGTFYVTFNHE